MFFFSDYKSMFPPFKKYLDHHTADEVVHAVGHRKPAKVVQFFSFAISTPWQKDRALQNLIESCFGFLRQHSLNRGQAKKFERLTTIYTIALQEIPQQKRAEKQAKKTEHVKSKAQPKPAANTKPQQSKTQEDSKPKAAFVPRKEKAPEVTLPFIPKELIEHANYKEREDFQNLVKMYHKLKQEQLEVPPVQAKKYFQEAFKVNTATDVKKLYRKLILILHDDKVNAMKLEEASKNYLKELFKFISHYYRIAIQ